MKPIVRIHRTTKEITIMQTSIKVKTALDQELKTIHGLLQQLSNDERINYIKEMIPALLADTQQITPASQRIAENRITPFNNLSEEQRKLIKEIAYKTECLYNLSEDQFQ